MGKIRRVSAVSGFARTSSSHTVGSIIAGGAGGALRPSISGVTGPRICSKVVRATESNGCTRPFARTGSRPKAVTSNPLPERTGRADAARYTTNMPHTIHGTRALAVTGKSRLAEDWKGRRICVSRLTASAPLRVQDGKVRRRLPRSFRHRALPHELASVDCFERPPGLEDALLVCGRVVFRIIGHARLCTRRGPRPRHSRC